VRKLTWRHRECLHQTFCQQGRFVLGASWTFERGVMASKAEMFVAVLFEEEERERWNREERNL
jgi:hypothetical protein